MALGLQALAHGHFWVYVNVGAGIQTLRLVWQVLLTMEPSFQI